MSIYKSQKNLSKSKFLKIHSIMLESISAKSAFLQDFIARGFYAQCTNLSALDQLMSKEKITAYIGFDCTASSLHVGSLLQIMIIRLLQKHGHQAIILLGGGTTKIGDPSGKDEARKVLKDEEISRNMTGIKKTLEQFIDFKGQNPAKIVNNEEWLIGLGYLDFLANFGRHFSINRMLSFDSVKLRLDREQPLSFLEFNYMILQAYDFVELRKKHNCILQIGGSDQWGNIVNGVELWRRMNSIGTAQIEKMQVGAKEIFGLTSPLLTTSDGKKMGKTADGAVWLDAELLQPFDYFQYFRNVSDADCVKFLKLFTELEISEIKNFEILEGKELNKAKEILAFEATKICHGEEIAKNCLQRAQEIFFNKNSTAFEEKIISFVGLKNKKLVEIIFEINAVASKADAKRLIEGNAVKVNGEAVLNVNHLIEKNDEKSIDFELSLGKKKFFKITLIP